MEIVLNDYSLNGQFETTEDFILWVHEEWIRMFAYLLEHKISIYKKSDFYAKSITDKETLYDLLQRRGDPLVTKIKSFIIDSAFSEPYWDVPGVLKTDLSNTYSCPCDDELPNCFSEAIERDKIILSIKNKEFVEEFYPYSKNEEVGKLINVVEYNSFLCWLLTSSLSDVKYVFENYKFERKIKFAEIAGRCYAEEAIQENELTLDDKKNVLLNISELIRGLSTGTKNRFWDKLSEGIFEYRISISAGREFRLLFVQDDGIVFLNGFIKKQQATPQHEIEKAKRIIRDLGV